MYFESRIPLHFIPATLAEHEIVERYAFMKIEMAERALFAMGYTAVLFFCAALSAYAEDTRVIRIATGEWEPFVGSKLVQGGPVNEIAKEILAQMGYKAEFTFAPWNRVTQMLDDGIADVSSCTWRSKEREQAMLFGEPVTNGDVVFIKRKGDPWSYKNLGSLTGKKVGIIDGYAYQKSFANAHNFFREESAGLPNVLKKLESGRVDIAIEDKNVLNHYLTQIDPTLSAKLEIDPHPIYSAPCYLGVSKKHPEALQLLKGMDAQLRKMKANGSYNQIMKSGGLVK
jgi:polar amino acid transport system substrate-binding protein